MSGVPDVEIVPDANALARRAADLVAARLEDARAERGRAGQGRRRNKHRPGAPREVCLADASGSSSSAEEKMGRGSPGLLVPALPYQHRAGTRTVFRDPLSLSYSPLVRSTCVAKFPALREAGCGSLSLSIHRRPTRGSLTTASGSSGRPAGDCAKTPGGNHPARAPAA